MKQAFPLAGGVDWSSSTANDDNRRVTVNFVHSYLLTKQVLWLKPEMKLMI